MNWQIQFYNERTQTLARYAVEAPTPAEALARGRCALREDYRPTASRRTRNLFEQARRVGGQDPEGWVLYRIAKA